MRKTIVGSLILVIAITLASCAPAPEAIEKAVQGTVAAFTAVPTYTPYPTYTVAPTQTLTPIPTLTQTSTPLPDCKANGTYADAKEDNLLGHVDILKVTSMLKEKTLEVTFQLRELPQELTINRDGLEMGNGEYVWGVNIDTDHDPATGGRNGFEYSLQAFHFKQRGSKTGAIQELFAKDTNLWQLKANGSMSTIKTGTIKVDLAANTITLSGVIPGITPDSLLMFTTFDANPGGTRQTDLVCGG